MRKLLFFFVVVFFTACSEEVTNDFSDIGIITGEDMRRCMCCGGWFININSETYRFTELPDDSDLDLFSEEFPLQVKVDWAPDENSCLGDEIIIEKIDIINQLD